MPRFVCVPSAEQPLWHTAGERRQPGWPPGKLPAPTPCLHGWGSAKPQALPPHLPGPGQRGQRLLSYVQCSARGGYRKRTKPKTPSDALKGASDPPCPAAPRASQPQFRGQPEASKASVLGRPGAQESHGGGTPVWGRSHNQWGR